MVKRFSIVSVTILLTKHYLNPIQNLQGRCIFTVVYVISYNKFHKHQQHVGNQSYSVLYNTKFNTIGQQSLNAVSGESPYSSNYASFDFLWHLNNYTLLHSCEVDSIDCSMVAMTIFVINCIAVRSYRPQILRVATFLQTQRTIFNILKQAPHRLLDTSCNQFYPDAHRQKSMMWSQEKLINGNFVQC